MRPKKAISIFEVDVNVDFAPAKDAPKEDEKQKLKPASVPGSPAVGSVPGSPMIPHGSPSPFSSPAVNSAHHTPQPSPSPSYFSQLGAGRSLSGARRPSSKSSPSPHFSPKSSKSPAMSPTPLSLNASPSSTVSPPSGQLKRLPSQASNSGVRRERVGRFDYIYNKDGKLMRRIPVRDLPGLGGSNPSSSHTTPSSSRTHSPAATPSPSTRPRTAGGSFVAFSGKGGSLR